MHLIIQTLNVYQVTLESLFSFIFITTNAFNTTSNISSSSADFNITTTINTSENSNLGVSMFSYEFLMILLTLSQTDLLRPLINDTNLNREWDLTKTRTRIRFTSQSITSKVHECQTTTPLQVREQTENLYPAYFVSKDFTSTWFLKKWIIQCYLHWRWVQLTIS